MIIYIIQIPVLDAGNKCCMLQHMVVLPALIISYLYLKKKKKKKRRTKTHTILLVIVNTKLKQKEKEQKI